MREKLRVDYNNNNEPPFEVQCCGLSKRCCRLVRRVEHRDMGNLMVVVNSENRPTREETAGGQGAVWIGHIKSYSAV